MKKLVFLMVCLGVLGFIGSVQAMPITYTDWSTGSGTIGAQTFSNALVTVSFFGDTANVSGSAGFFTNTVGTGTVSIAGIGTATFTDSVYAFVNQGFPAAGIASSTAAGSILDTVSSTFTTYDLISAIGPITDSTFFRFDLSYATTLGTLNFSAMDSSSTFKASNVPVPSSLLLFGPGLACLAAARRRFKK